MVSAPGGHTWTRMTGVHWAVLPSPALPFSPEEPHTPASTCAPSMGLRDGPCSPQGQEARAIAFAQV